jgi:membrane protease YdiL (CAAX protease family)
MWRFEYPAHAAFVAPALEKAQLWRTAIGFVLVVIAFISLGPVIYSFVFQPLYQLDGDLGAANVIALLFSFATVTIGVFGAICFVHTRHATTVFGPVHMVIDQFCKVAMGIIYLLLIIELLPPWGYGEPLIARRALGAWAMVLPIALLGVFLQSSAEEILFRGYLQQQLCARFGSPLVWMLVPSALFAIAHYDPQNAGENAWIVVAWAGLFGLAMADLTARAGNLGPAIAVHFVNNVMGLLIVALPDELGGAALYVLPQSLSNFEALREWMPVNFATMFVMWVVARLVIRR